MASLLFQSASYEPWMLTSLIHAQPGATVSRMQYAENFSGAFPPSCALRSSGRYHDGRSQSTAVRKFVDTAPELACR